MVFTSDAQQDWYTTLNTAAWILVQLLTSTTSVHNINSPKNSRNEDYMQAMMFQEVVWMLSVLHTMIIQVNIVLSVLHLLYLLLAIKLSIVSLQGIKPIFETLCLYSYILTPSFIYMTSHSTNLNTDRIIEILINKHSNRMFASSYL